MLVTKKMLLALTLIGAIVGAGIGSLATRSTQSTTAASTGLETTASANTQPVSYNAKTPDQIANDRSLQFSTSAEQSAYRQGFDDGLASCGPETNPNTTRSSIAPATYRSTYRAPRRSSSNRRVYYDYASAPKGRTFWQKHRDKLTLAIGTGAGAALGGLIGGKKGAGIGALAGLGSSALYTYKIRKRNRY
jgi:hypothetical protein